MKKFFNNPRLQRSDSQILEVPTKLPAIMSPKSLNVDHRIKKPIIPARNITQFKCKQITRGTMSIIKQSEQSASLNRRFLLRKGLKNSTRNKLKVKTIQ